MINGVVQSNQSLRPTIASVTHLVFARSRQPRLQVKKTLEWQGLRMADGETEKYY